MIYTNEAQLADCNPNVSSRDSIVPKLFTVYKQHYTPTLYIIQHSYKSRELIFLWFSFYWVYFVVRTCELFLCFAAFVFLGFIVLTSLFSLFDVTCECNRFLHRGWAFLPWFKCNNPLFQNHYHTQNRGKQIMSFYFRAISSMPVILPSDWSRIVLCWPFGSIFCGNPLLIFAGKCNNQ